MNFELFSNKLPTPNQLMALKAGDKAPEINSIDQDEKPISLAQFKGKKVALYFYPQDDTPTCTIEACNLRDNETRLKSSGYQVIGVSPDESKKHLKFIKKYGLPFPLIADTDLKVINDYGVWAEKTTFGRTYMGVLRTTFLIDEKGVISKVIDKVESKVHTDQILGL
jgi:peroxiredoxin Q/BCP